MLITRFSFKLSQRLVIRSTARVHHRLLCDQAPRSSIPSNLPLTEYGNEFYSGKWTLFFKRLKLASFVACFMTVYGACSLDVGDPNDESAPLIKFTIDASTAMDRVIVVLPLVVHCALRRYITHMYYNYYTQTFTAARLGFLQKEKAFLEFKRDAIQRTTSSSPFMTRCVIQEKSFMLQESGFMHKAFIPVFVKSESSP